MSSTISTPSDANVVRTPSYAYFHEAARERNDQVDSHPIRSREDLEHAVNLRATLILNGVIYQPTGQIVVPA
jgi:bifunctional pyridoxal-dependent enzyme with beta-cystathionase and maltose regulon repressor activities